jgi:acylphosphatase
MALSVAGYADAALSTPAFGAGLRPPPPSDLARYDPAGMIRERLHIFYSGRVQGVGFRYTAKVTAHGFEVTGLVRNLMDGLVELVAEGHRSELEAFRLAIQDSEVGRFVRQEEVNWSPAKNEFRGFEIVG